MTSSQARADAANEVTEKDEGKLYVSLFMNRGCRWHISDADMDDDDDGDDDDDDGVKLQRCQKDSSFRSLSSCKQVHGRNWLLNDQEF